MFSATLLLKFSQYRIIGLIQESNKEHDAQI